MLENSSSHGYQYVKENILREKARRLQGHLEGDRFSTDQKTEIESVISALEEPLRLEILYTKLKQRYANNIDTLCSLVKDWNDYISARIELDTLLMKYHFDFYPKPHFSDDKANAPAEALLRTLQEVKKRFEALSD